MVNNRSFSSHLRPYYRNKEFEYTFQGVTYKALMTWDGVSNVVTFYNNSPDFKWKYIWRYYDLFVWNVSKDTVEIE